MSRAKWATAAVVVAMTLSACGVGSKPEAGTPQAAAHSNSSYSDPRSKHVKCLRADHIPFHELTLEGNKPSIQVGTRPSGPTVVFMATPGAAQNDQIQGRAQGAEVIGAALVYPNQAPNALMNKVEACMAEGVTG